LVGQIISLKALAGVLYKSGENVDIRCTIERLLRDGFILVFNQDKLDVVKTAQALMKAEVYNMEVTCRIQTPLEKIYKLKKEFSQFCVGAATLVDFAAMLNIYNQQHSDDPIPTLKEAVEAGADYLVSAVNFSDEAYKKYAGRVMMIPGCGTATEIVEQYSKGANMCKLFPAKELGGSAYIKAIDPAVHKLISIIPTGGTTLENIPDYISAGVLVLGGSFSMIAKETFKKIADEQNYELLSNEIKKVKVLIDACRSKQYPGLNFKSDSLDHICRATGRNFNISR
jgi:2-dehydro-3-deoxyphosphogluconate aldolase/(4S)-4-hydroxy-2-oxoglutarate aldolase